MDCFGVHCVDTVGRCTILTGPACLWCLVVVSPIHLPTQNKLNLWFLVLWIILKSTNLWFWHHQSTVPFWAFEKISKELAGFVEEASTPKDWQLRVGFQNQSFDSSLRTWFRVKIGSLISINQGTIYWTLYPRFLSLKKRGLHKTY